MIKNPNKSQREIEAVPEEVKHKKKSQSKGQPRSKHKHKYETVLLTKYYHHNDFKTGAQKITQTETPTKVCTICGRIDCFDKDPKYYLRKPISGLPIAVWKDELSEEALKLPKWYCDDYFDKFAKRMEDTNNEPM